jgi:hypothetical protein
MLVPTKEEVIEQLKKLHKGQLREMDRPLAVANGTGNQGSAEYWTTAAMRKN